MNSVIEEIEKKQMKKSLPGFSVGDTVVVSKEIIEGKKKRIQKYEGIIIKIQNNYVRKNITVRKIVGNVGVEKTFFVHAPSVVKIERKVKGKVRRAKLFYLRNRVGKKATRIKKAT